jgi:hypothetical protein
LDTITTWTANAIMQEAAPTTRSVNAVQASIPVVTMASATVTISAPGLDQDGDGTSDNEEGSGDANNNGIPNYLDPTTPTNEPPTQQPGVPKDLFLPSLGNN